MGSSHGTGSSSVRRGRRSSLGGSTSSSRPQAAADQHSNSNSHSNSQTLTLDVAALAEQGYIEVIDGKMKLVVDVEQVVKGASS